MMRIFLVLSALLPALGAATEWNGEADVATVKAAGSRVRRNLADRFAEVVNVRDFGANADGVCDDTGAIQAAITAAAAAHGVRAVYFPRGSSFYRVTATITVPAGVTLRGEGYQFSASEVRGTTDRMGDVFLVYSAGTVAGDVQFEHLTISAAAGLASPPNGIHFRDCNEMLIERVMVGPNLAAGVLLDGSTIMGFHKVTSTGNAVGFKLTAHASGKVTANSDLWFGDLNVWNASTAAFSISGIASHVSVRDSHLEWTPTAFLVQQDATAGMVPNTSLNDFALDAVTFRNAGKTPFTDARLIRATAPAGPGNFMVTSGFRLRNVAVYAETAPPPYLIEYTKGTNGHGSTAFGPTLFDGGYYFGAQTAVQRSDVQTSGMAISPVAAFTHSSGGGAPVPLGTGSVKIATVSDNGNGSLTISGAINVGGVVLPSNGGIFAASGASASLVGGAATGSNVPAWKYTNSTTFSGGGDVIARWYSDSGATPVVSMYSATGKLVYHTAGNSTGKPGSATINQAAGRSAFAAGEGSITITNSLVSSSSLVFAVLQTADSTLTSIKTVIPTAGAFTITGNGRATAPTNVAWWVLN
jgi:hypothetical protein